MIASPADYARFCHLMLGGGPQALSPAATRAMPCDQLTGMPQVPEQERRCRPWDLGWRLNWPGHSANFGGLLGPRSFGRRGATSTRAWTDPDAGAFMLLFTTQPQGDDGRFLERTSNAVAAALDGAG